MARPLISIVTPVYNEEANVEACAAEVARVFEQELPDWDYEQVFCDNASTDATLSVLRRIAAADPRVRIVANANNVGPLRNIANGIRHVSGDYVVPMIPADLQDPPAVVPRLLERLDENVDVVYGVRTNRKEGALLRAARGLYYWMIRIAGGAAPPSHAGEFLLARRWVIDAVNARGTGSAYVRGLVAQTNPRSATVPYEWGVREHGSSRNSVSSLIDQAMTGLVTTVRAPVRWAMLIGLVAAVAGVIFAIVTAILFAVGAASASPGTATIIVGVFLLGGIQIFLIGVIGEYVVSIHSSLNPESPVIVRELINFPHAGSATEPGATLGP